MHTQVFPGEMVVYISFAFVLCSSRMSRNYKTIYSASDDASKVQKNLSCVYFCFDGRVNQSLLVACLHVTDSTVQEKPWHTCPQG